MSRLSSEEKETRFQSLKILLGEGFQMLPANAVDFLLKRPHKTVSDAFKFLTSKVIPKNKIIQSYSLLGRRVGALEKGYDCLAKELAISEKKILVWPDLLKLSPKTLRSKHKLLVDEYHIRPEDISTFAKILTSPMHIIKTNYKFLKEEVKMSEEDISRHASLLFRSSRTLKTNFKLLQEGKFELSQKKIAKFGTLLGKSMETTSDNYDFLKDNVGVSSKKIRTHASKLFCSQETMETNISFLVSKLKIKEGRIAINPQLIGLPPKTLQKAWANRRRMVSAESIRSHPQTLGNSDDTFEANISWFHTYKINPGSIILFDTTPQKKREKVVWIAKNVFGAGGLTGEERRDAIEKARLFVRLNPKEKIYPGIKTLEKNLPKLHLLSGKMQKLVA